MSHIEILSEGPVDRNPNPGYDHVSTFFSHLVQLTDREILCAYNRGSAIYATDLTFHAAYSTDGGQSWPEQTVIHDRSTNDAPYQPVEECRLTGVLL
jgi:hypothetical protein